MKTLFKYTFLGVLLAFFANPLLASPPSEQSPFAFELADYQVDVVAVAPAAGDVYVFEIADLKLGSYLLSEAEVKSFSSVLDDRLSVLENRLLVIKSPVSVLDHRQTVINSLISVLETRQSEISNPRSAIESPKKLLESGSVVDKHQLEISNPKSAIGNPLKLPDPYSAIETRQSEISNQKSAIPLKGHFLNPRILAEHSHDTHSKPPMPGWCV